MIQSTAQIKKTKLSPLNRVFVGGIPLNVTKDELVLFFEKFGKVSSIVIPKNKKTGKSKGYALINFFFEKEMKKVLEMKELELKGKKITVRKALNRKNASKETRELQKRKIFVQGLDSLTTEKELFNFFSLFGEIDRVLMGKVNSKNNKKKSQNNRVAYIVMKTLEGFENVFRASIENAIKFKNYHIFVSPSKSVNELKEERQKLNNARKEGDLRIDQFDRFSINREKVKIKEQKKVELLSIKNSNSFTGEGETDNSSQEPEEDVTIQQLKFDNGTKKMLFSHEEKKIEKSGFFKGDVDSMSNGQGESSVESLSYYRSEDRGNTSSFGSCPSISERPIREDHHIWKSNEHFSSSDDSNLFEQSRLSDSSYMENFEPYRVNEWNNQQNSMEYNYLAPHHHIFNSDDEYSSPRNHGYFSNNRNVNEYRNNIDFQLHQHQQNSSSLTGQDLIRKHHLVFKTAQLNNTVNSNQDGLELPQTHEEMTFSANLTGGQFSDQRSQLPARNSFFGPNNSFGDNVSDPRHMRNRYQREIFEGGNPSSHNQRRYYGPVFLPSSNALQEGEDEPSQTVQIKQTITTEYVIKNEGVVYRGVINETNIWGSHPHREF